MVSARQAVFELCTMLKLGGIEDTAFEAKEIFRETTGKLPIITDEITQEQLGEMLTLAKKRTDGVPLQYLFGKWEFYGLTFLVGEGVLIPRPETELLAELAIKKLKNGGKMLDLCSGTGCVAISAAKNTSAEVWAVELYEKAFSFLEKNAALNSAEITAINGDALDGAVVSERTFDVITANPPYLTRTEMDELQREVRFEPETALFGGEDGLDFYRALIPIWSKRLSADGALAFEVGDGQAEAVGEMLSQAGLEAEILPDLQGIGRVVFGKKVD